MVSMKFRPYFSPFISTNVYAAGRPSHSPCITVPSPPLQNSRNLLFSCNHPGSQAFKNVFIIEFNVSFRHFSFPPSYSPASALLQLRLIVLSFLKNALETYDP